LQIQLNLLLKECFRVVLKPLLKVLPFEVPAEKELNRVVRALVVEKVRAETSGKAGLGKAEAAIHKIQELL